jgi:proteic killer suppression protein
MDRVVLTDQARKDLRKIPLNVRRKFELWVKQVTLIGIIEVRKIPGFHDEPLRGSSQGQRSVRLSRSYRAFYRVFREHLIQLISVEEINKHDY